MTSTKAKPSVESCSSKPIRPLDSAGQHAFLAHITDNYDHYARQATPFWESSYPPDQILFVMGKPLEQSRTLIQAADRDYDNEKAQKGGDKPVQLEQIQQAGRLPVPLLVLQLERRAKELRGNTHANDSGPSSLTSPAVP